MNLRADERSCDMCGARIPKGDKYVVSKVPREKARLYLEAMEANPELSATVTPDSQGNLRWDICLASTIQYSRVIECLPCGLYDLD